MAAVITNGHYGSLLCSEKNVANISVLLSAGYFVDSKENPLHVLHVSISFI